MPLNVLLGNMKDAASSPAGVAEVRQLFEEFGATRQPEFTFLAEAYAEGHEQELPALRTWAEDRGLLMFNALYDDDREAHAYDRHGWVAFAAGSLVVGKEAEILNLGKNDNERHQGIGRTAVKLCMRDPESGKEVDMFGAHLDDRNKADNVAQALSLLSHTEEGRSTALVIQANSMAPSVQAPILRILGMLVKDWPKVEPGAPKPEGGLITVAGRDWYAQRFASLGTRLGDMAAGATVKLFKRAGFIGDSARLHRATVHIGKIPIGKVDHIFVRDAVVTASKTLKNPVTPTTKEMTQVPHRLLLGNIHVN